MMEEKRGPMYYVLREIAYSEGFAQGLIIGHMDMLQKRIIDLIHIRFPSLEPLACEQLAQIEARREQIPAIDIDAEARLKVLKKHLEALLDQLLITHDEQQAAQLLFATCNEEQPD